MRKACTVQFDSFGACTAYGPLECRSWEDGLGESSLGSSNRVRKCCGVPIHCLPQIAFNESLIHGNVPSERWNAVLSQLPLETPFQGQRNSFLEGSPFLHQGRLLQLKGNEIAGGEALTTSVSNATIIYTQKSLLTRDISPEFRKAGSLINSLSSRTGHIPKGVQGGS